MHKFRDTSPYMNIKEAYSLKAHNTFGIDAQADWFITYDSLEDLQKLISDEYFQECRLLHIGSGSNLLFLTNYHGIVLQSLITSLECEVSSDEAGSVSLRVGAGMLWDDLVAYCVGQGYWGIENLSLIPGTVGAAAIQNIGAYGVEVSSVVEAVEAVHRRTGEHRTFSNQDCYYAYRYSAFKEAEMQDWLVVYVRLRLCQTARPVLGYAGLQDELKASGTQPSLEAIRSAVIRIRQSKLPDTSELGSAGSFFMNPTVEAEEAQRLLQSYPNMPTYPQAGGRVKLSAGWLIDQAGYKGYKRGRAGVYERQALVLVNLGGATGQEIAQLAEEVQQAVLEKYGVQLHPEVRYIS